MLAKTASLLSRLKAWAKPSNRLKSLETMSMDKAYNHVAAILNSQGESTTAEYQSIMALVIKYPQLARMEVFRAAGHSTNDERSILLVALATKRIGSTWTEHMELMELVYLAFPGGIETRDPSNGRVPLHAACNNYMPQSVVLFLLHKCPWSSMMPDNSGAWPSLYRHFQDPCVYREIVTNLVRAFAEEDKLHRVPLKGRDNFDGWQNDVPSPLLVAFGMKIRRSEVLRLLILPNPTGKRTRLDLMNGNVSDMAHLSVPPQLAKLLARRVAPWIQELWIDIGLLFSIQGLSTFFANLADAKPAYLRFVALSFDGSSALLSNASILECLPGMLRCSPNLKCLKVLITARSPVETFQGDLVLRSIAAGLGENPSIEELSVHLDPAYKYASVGLATILSTCQNLHSIKLSLNSCSREIAALLGHGIRNSMALAEVSLSFSGKFGSSDVNGVIEAIAASSSAKKLVLGVLTQSALVLPGLSQLTNLRTLDLSMTAMKSSSYLNRTNPLLDLLEAPNNLVSLYLSPLHLPPYCLWKILKRNTVLERIEFCRSSEHDILSLQIGGIVDALRHTNRTLRDVKTFHDEVPASLMDQLAYYLRLNCAGRAQVMNAETATASTVLEALEGVIGDESIDDVTSTSLAYELLRECPHLWASGQVVVVDDEDSGFDDDWHW